MRPMRLTIRLSPVVGTHIVLSPLEVAQPLSSLGAQVGRRGCLADTWKVARLYSGPLQNE